MRTRVERCLHHGFQRGGSRCGLVGLRAVCTCLRARVSTAIDTGVHVHARGGSTREHCHGALAPVCACMRAAAARASTATVTGVHVHHGVRVAGTRLRRCAKAGGAAPRLRLRLHTQCRVSVQSVGNAPSAVRRCVSKRRRQGWGAR